MWLRLQVVLLVIMLFKQTSFMDSTMGAYILFFHYADRDLIRGFDHLYGPLGPVRGSFIWRHSVVEALNIVWGHLYDNWMWIEYYIFLGISLMPSLMGSYELNIFCHFKTYIIHCIF